MDEVPANDNGITEADQDAPVILAKAKYAFNGKNNDELSFPKGEVILITQKLDEGWWEGTLNGETGWFPSNYVEEITEKDKLLRSRSVPNTEGVIGNTAAAQPMLTDFVVTTAARHQFRIEVMNDFIKHESAYLESLTRTCDEYLLPLKIANIMNIEDYEVLCGKIEQILEFQNSVLYQIKTTLQIEIPQQRVGGILLAAAPKLRNMMMEYCYNHPRAVEVINEKDVALRNFVSTIDAGNMSKLIKGLSEPFRHLDSYPGFLQELERNIADSHIDRGDVHRSCEVYKDIKYECEAHRKQKEMQMEFLAAGQVDQWAPFSERGKIQYLGLVDIEKQGQEPEPRFVVLFSNLMLILEVTAEQNTYKLSEKWKVAQQTIKKVEGRNAFAFGQEPPIVFSMGSSFEVDRWLEAFKRCADTNVEEGTTIIQPTTPVKYDVNELTSLSPARQPQVSELPSSERAKLGKKMSFGPNDLKLNHDLEMIVPEGDEPEEKEQRGSNMYSGFCLRPYPPMRGPSVAVDYGKKTIKMRREPTIHNGDDAQLLRIVEGYWQGGKGVAQAYENPIPQLIVAEDEKILVEEIVGGEVVFQEKSLVDTVYALKDQLSNLQKTVETLIVAHDKEQRARRRLEDLVRRGSTHLNASSITSAPTTPKPDSAMS